MSGKDEIHKGERESKVKRKKDRAGTCILQFLSYGANRCGTFCTITMVSVETRSYFLLGYCWGRDGVCKEKCVNVYASVL